METELRAEFAENVSIDFVTSRKSANGKLKILDGAAADNVTRDVTRHHHSKHRKTCRKNVIQRRRQDSSSVEITSPRSASAHRIVYEELMRCMIEILFTFTFHLSNRYGKGRSFAGSEGWKGKAHNENENDLSGYNHHHENVARITTKDEKPARREFTS